MRQFFHKIYFIRGKYFKGSPFVCCMFPIPSLPHVLYSLLHVKYTSTVIDGTYSTWLTETISSALFITLRYYFPCQLLYLFQPIFSPVVNIKHSYILFYMQHLCVYYHLDHLNFHEAIVSLSLSAILTFILIVHHWIPNIISLLSIITVGLEGSEETMLLLNLVRFSPEI